MCECATLLRFVDWGGNKPFSARLLKPNRSKIGRLTGKRKLSKSSSQTFFGHKFVVPLSIVWIWKQKWIEVLWEKVLFIRKEKTEKWHQQKLFFFFWQLWHFPLVVSFFFLFIINIYSFINNIISVPTFVFHAKIVFSFLPLEYTRKRNILW